MRPSRRYTRLIERFFPHRFLIARLSHVPMIRWIITKMVFEKNNLTYLTRDNVIETNTIINGTQVDTIAVPSKVVNHFIEQSSFRFIMDFCICRESMNCETYSSSLGCLFMGDAAKKIPTELGRSVSKKEALHHIKTCQEEGLVHLIGRDMLDETWLGVGSKIPLVTVCNCCECCCLWRMRPYLHHTLSSTIKKMPGIHINVNENCTGCGICTKDICFIKGISIQNGKAVVEKDCVVCGRCAETCPHNAIDIIIDNQDFIKDTIERVRKATT